LYFFFEKKKKKKLFCFWLFSWIFYYKFINKNWEKLQMKMNNIFIKEIIISLTNWTYSFTSTYTASPKSIKIHVTKLFKNMNLLWWFTKRIMQLLSTVLLLTPCIYFLILFFFLIFFIFLFFQSNHSLSAQIYKIS
jgi:hypothetical protein